MAIELRAVEKGGVSLSLFFVVAVDLADDVVEVEDPHSLLELLNVAGRPALKNLAAAHIDQRAVGKAADATPAIVALDYLFMAKNATLPEVLQLVANLLGGLAHLPRLLVDGVPEVGVNLDDSLHDELSLPDDVEGRRVLPYIVQSGSLRQLQLLRRIVEVKKVNSVPLAEER